MLFDRRDLRVSAQTAAVVRSGRRPALTLQASRDVRTSAHRHMVSYLIVRLEMQYLHIVSRMAVTSPGGGRHTKRAHMVPRRSEKSCIKNKTKKKNNTKLQSFPTSSTPPVPRRATKSTVCASSNPDHKLHPTSFTFLPKAGEETHTSAAEATLDLEVPPSASFW